MEATHQEYLARAVAPRPYRGHPPGEPIRQEDADLIQKYLDRKTRKKEVREGTARVMAEYLAMLSRRSPLFTEMTTADFDGLIDDFRAELKQNTTRRFIAVTKAFVKWLVSEGYNEKIEVAKLAEIKAPQRDKNTKAAGEMLTADDVKKVIETCENSRDRALVALVYEGALRPVEAAMATWGDLVFDKFGAAFHTSEKTGKERYIRLIWSAPYLLAWRNDYPRDSKKKTAPVFVGNRLPHAPLSTSRVRGTLAALLKASGLDVGPYYLRHSRITAMVADEIPESIIKLQVWGDVDTRMLSTYLHLKNPNIDRIMLSHAGIETAEKVDPVSPKAPQCSHCGNINPLTARFCITCGLPLTEKAGTDERQTLADIRNHPLYKAIMADLQKK